MEGRELLRLTVRLALDTLCGIQELKEELEKDDLNNGLKLTNGFVINQSYYDSKDMDWKEVLQSPIKFDLNKNVNPASTRNNLELQEEVINGIKELKMLLPTLINEIRPGTPIKYVTTGYTIKVMIKGALIKKKE